MDQGKWELRSVKIQTWMAVLAFIASIIGLGLAYNAFIDQQEINRSQITLNQLAQNRFERRYAARIAFWREDEPMLGFEPGGATAFKGTLSVQNRSPIPIRHVEIAAPDVDVSIPLPASAGSATPKIPPYRLLVHLLEVKPCTVITIRITQADLVAASSGVAEVANLSTQSSVWLGHFVKRGWGWSGFDDTLYFSDPEKRWQIDATGTRSINALDIPGPWARGATLVLKIENNDYPEGKGQKGPIQLEHNLDPSRVLEKEAQDCGEAG